MIRRRAVRLALVLAAAVLAAFVFAAPLLYTDQRRSDAMDAARAERAEQTAILIQLRADIRALCTTLRTTCP